MKYEIEITEKAKSDIRGIYDYIAFGTACAGNCRESAQQIGEKHHGT
jgi:plasmid stabilization system protein ParE